MKFSEHLIKQPHLLFCGKCPVIGQPNCRILGFCEPNPIGTPKQENTCGIFKSFSNGLENGPNPKKCDGCLKLFKHFHSQISKRKHPGYDNRPCGGENDWARYDEDGPGARSRS